MIIYPDQGAGMCNRLHAAAHLLAHAEETGNKTVTWALQKYNHYFCGLPKRGPLYYKPAFSRPLKIRCPFALLRSGAFPLRQLEFSSSVKIAKAESAALTVIVGWRFRDSKALQRHGDKIKAILTPRDIYMQHVNACVENARNGVDNLIGVHIRRGDYLNYCDGLYYYNDQFYLAAMQRKAHELGGRCGFLIASDEDVDLDNFPRLKVSLAPGHELEDLYSLSMCDYIIGPSSTYSSWAAFYGSVPLWHVSRDGMKEGAVNIDRGPERDYRFRAEEV